MEISVRTVEIVRRVLYPYVEDRVIPNPEYQAVVRELGSLAKTGSPVPAIVPRLVSMEEAAGMLGISLAHFKSLEHDGRLPFPRRKLGTAVRFRNTDIIGYIMSDKDMSGKEHA